MAEPYPRPELEVGQTRFCCRHTHADGTEVKAVPDSSIFDAFLPSPSGNCPFIPSPCTMSWIVVYCGVLGEKGQRGWVGNCAAVRRAAAMQHCADSYNWNLPSLVW